MRLVKDTAIESSKLTEVSEFEYLNAFYKCADLKNFRYIQYCDIPEEKTPTGRLSKMVQWGSSVLIKTLATKPRTKLRQIIAELKILNKVHDDKKYYIKGKQGMIAYLLEEAYKAGLIRAQGPVGKKELPKKEEVKNGNSKKDKQETSEKSDSAKSTKQRRQRKSSK